MMHRIVFANLEKNRAPFLSLFLLKCSKPMRIRRRSVEIMQHFNVKTVSAEHIINTLLR